MSAIVVDDHIVHYEVLGRGRPLILLHGWLGSWRYWIPVMQAASTDYRAYALDLWGFGDSDHAPGRYTPESQSELIRSFMKSMGVSRAAFVGHGLGGLVGLYLTEHHPELAERLMLVSVPLSIEDANARLGTSAPKELADWLVPQGEGSQAVLAEIHKSDQEALKMWYSPDGAAVWTPNVESLQTPCLVVHGLKDPAVRAPTGIPALADGTKNHVVSFEESGHFPMLEETTKFCRLLVDFLSLPSGEPVSQLQLKTEWKRRVR